MKWEYLEVYVAENQSAESVLNKYGLQGWEAVTVRPVEGRGDEVYLMKRPLQEFNKEFY